jgi:GTPase
MLPKVILVDIIPPHVSPTESLARLNELERLVDTYGGFVVVRKVQRKQQPNYRTYIGTGKVEEILQSALELNAKYLIVNNMMKSEQLYNLEREFTDKHQIKVWDKIDLILAIFAKHAVTKEAKLQIELAKLRHFGPRISKMGVELMRQGGGIGTRGKGETNIEIMKRHIRTHEFNVRQELKKIEVSQENQRKQRHNHGFRTVAIVGYTNAGKSQLLNSLTRKEVKVKDELFATLDSRIGKLWLPDAQVPCLVSDTIGFIRDLPPQLIDAFHSTLNETLHADLILHVIDIDDLDMEWKIKVVHEVLDTLKCGHKKVLYVFNKIDLLQYDHKRELAEKYGHYDPVFISAKEKTNLDELKSKIAKHLFPEEVKKALENSIAVR